MGCTHCTLLLAAVLVSLTFGGEASAAEIVVLDNEGRPIRFDVRAEGVDVEWYAALCARRRPATRSRQSGSISTPAKRMRGVSKSPATV